VGIQSGIMGVKFVQSFSHFFWFWPPRKKAEVLKTVDLFEKQKKKRISFSLLFYVLMPSDERKKTSSQLLKC
jgi:hypothetical protein